MKHKSVFCAVILLIALWCPSIGYAGAKEMAELHELKMEDGGILVAKKPFEIYFWGEAFQGEYNARTKQYELNIPVSFAERTGGMLLDDISPLDCYFCYNGEYVWFMLNNHTTSWGYVSRALKNRIPEQLNEVLNDFHCPVVIDGEKFVDKELDEHGGYTSYLEKFLVTPKGVIDKYILIMINYNCLEFDLDYLMWHEVGHAMVADYLLRRYEDSDLRYESWDKQKTEHDLVNFVVRNYFNNDDSVVDYYTTEYARDSGTIGEVVAEALGLCAVYPDEVDDFNYYLCQKLLGLWCVKYQN